MSRAALAALAALLLLAGAMLATRFLAIARMQPPPRQVVPPLAVADPRPQQSLWPAPDFSFPDQHNRTVTRQQLRGHVWIADFIYTQCRSACPMMTARMVLLQRQLAGSGVQFVSFSVDPAHDTPAVLERYARQWHADETRWRLLSTTPAALQATVAGMRMMVAATTDPADPIVHSDRFVLVDAVGLVRGVYDSAEAEDLKQLVADAARLPGAAATDAGAALDHQPTSGPALYGALGCRGCHDRPELAPRLDGLAGSTVTLTDGRHVRADDAYLRASILEPATDLVAGYGATMPSYAGQLADGQLAALVAYVEQLAATDPRAADAETRRLVVDPVCKMEVSAGAADPHVDHAGHRYYFCSETCRNKFSADPGRYASPTAN